MVFVNVGITRSFLTSDGNEGSTLKSDRRSKAPNYAIYARHTKLFSKPNCTTKNETQDIPWIYLVKIPDKKVFEGHTY